jgi:uncharacterized protein (DUF433 family)
VILRNVARRPLDAEGRRAQLFRLEPAMHDTPRSLIGIGLYSATEASSLVQVSASKIARWLRGHYIGARRYERLWQPQVDLGDDGLFLSFRDLMEVRVAAAFIRRGLSPQKVRSAINLARNIIQDDHPLSTTWLKTDGRSVFLQIAEEDGTSKLIDLFKSQYAFQEIVERSLRNVDFDADGLPARWWPLGKGKAIVVDPAKCFGRPIEATSSVPAEVLASAAKAEGSAKAAARAWSVPLASITRAVAFQREMERRKAA